MRWLYAPQRGQAPGALDLLAGGPGRGVFSGSITDFFDAISLDNSGTYLNGYMLVDANTNEGGADFIVIASNTINSLADTVQQEVGLPVLHIADATGAAFRKKGLHTVALLGTKYTMEQPFYQDRLTKYGIKVVIPDEKERDYINAVIFDELCANRIQRESREGFKKIIERLRKEEGAEGVILGCTEIPLLIKQGDVSIPVFDTTAIHSEAAVEYSLNSE